MVNLDKPQPASNHERQAQQIVNHLHGHLFCYFIDKIHNALYLYCVLDCAMQANNDLFMVAANYTLVAAFRHRNTSTLQGSLDKTIVMPYP